MKDPRVEKVEGSETYFPVPLGDSVNISRSESRTILGVEPIFSTSLGRSPTERLSRSN
jgi:hypothetical protein